MKQFIYNASSVRVVFGAGTRGQLAQEIQQLGRSRALILTTPQQRSEGEGLLAEIGAFGAGILSGARMHTPVETTQQAVEICRDLEADCLIALGGGSTTGLGKAIALETDLPQIVIPTTYAGSEATNILGQTRNGEKTTLRSPRVLPEVIIYDVDLTLTLPSALSAVSGMNAIAHAVEALYAADGNPVVDMMAEEAIRVFANALPEIMLDPSNRKARNDALYASWLCGSCLNAVSMGLHHKLCHTLGGMLDLPHAETHTVILPHACQFNAGAAPDAMTRIARALGSETASAGLFDLVASFNAPTSLQSLGVDVGRLQDVARQAVRVPYPNPRPLSEGAILELLENAFSGLRPISN